MNNRLKAYKGEENYTFISYAHKDFDQVHEILCELDRLGFNLWYDEGIDPGNEWAEEIADALYKSRLFIVFVSKNAMNSKNVINECFYALDNGIPYLAIFLEDTEYTKGLSLRASSTQAVMKYRMSDADFYNKASNAMRTMLSDSYNESENGNLKVNTRKKPQNLLVKKLSLPIIVLIVIGLFSAFAYSAKLLTELSSELSSLKNASTEFNAVDGGAGDDSTESSASDSENINETTMAQIESTVEIKEEISKEPIFITESTTKSIVTTTNNVSTSTSAPIYESKTVGVGYGVEQIRLSNGDFETKITRDFLPLYAQYATRVRVHGNSLKQSANEVFESLNNPNSISKMNSVDFPSSKNVITVSSVGTYYEDHFITLASDDQILLIIHVKDGSYFNAAENDILVPTSVVSTTEAVASNKTTLTGINANDLEPVIILSYGLKNELDLSNFGFRTTVDRSKLPEFAKVATNLSVWGNSDGYNIQTAFDLLVDGEYWKRHFSNNFASPLTKSYFDSSALYYDNHFVILSNEEKVLMVIQIKNQEQVAILENN